MANKVITVLEADGVTQTDVVSLDVGRQGIAASKSVAMATEDKAVLDAMAASLVTIDGRVDGLETLIGTTNTTLTTIDGRVDGLETLITSTNTKLDTAITALQIIDNMVLSAGTANIGDVDVLTVPTDPFGANADAASATGSVSAKLRGIATALGVTALDLGQGTGGSRTLRVAIDSAQLDGAEYETVAASQTTQTLGATGATGDYLREVLVIPATTSPGNILIKDGSNTAITVFTGGASSVSNLVPFTISLGLTSTAGAWQLTTGANVSAIGVGNFT